MKRFIKIYRKDKENFKMINQTDHGFELVIISDDVFEDFLKTINKYEENSDEINVVWQFKFKHDVFSLYKDCIFSTPKVNFYGGIRGKKAKPFGMKFSVTCKGKNTYSYKKEIDNPFSTRKPKNYKDGKLLERMLKIGELELKNE